MADLVGAGGAPATSNGGGMPSPRRPTGAPAPTSSPSGIRGPRMIMQERAAREARQRAEAERQQLERARAERESQLQEEAQRAAAAERRSAGVATGQEGRPSAQQYMESSRQGHSAQPSMSGAADLETTHRTNTNRFAANQQLPSHIYSSQQSSQPQAQPQYQTPQPRPQQPQQPQMPTQAGVESSTQPAATSATAGGSKPRNSFPHAFERWETLSAHWEGLTSYWIRKLDQNKDELSRDPVSQQLARQVTDLSAAGANLFHAVVELQRLRASSERKFQRWFFETRTELERAQEVNSMLENALDQERRNRDEAVREALEKDQGSSQAERKVNEMRKELAISKDEARRAWEELGRREQVERDRTLSLQSGHPTIIGGVQVVPMTHGAPGRQPSAREQQPYQTGYGQSHAPEQGPSPAGPASPAPAASSGGYYRQQETRQAQAGYGVGVAEGGHSEGEYVTDVQGHPILDNRGNRIPLAAPPSTCSGSDAEVEEYETPATTNPPSGNYEPPISSAPVTSAPQSQGQGQWTGAYSDPQDYTGEGYGAEEWEAVQRESHHHHHPTRLSDVIEEEDERSRTSASQSHSHSHSRSHGRA